MNTIYPIHVYVLTLDTMQALVWDLAQAPLE